VNAPLLWGLLAAVPAVLAEYLYRKWDPATPWWHGLYMWVPIQLAIGYGIYRLVTVPNTTLLDAFVVWALATTSMRVFVSVVVLGDPVKGGTWFALALLVLAKVAQTFWGR
jgi:multidrug transporter EmrE-like cation transporter